MKELLTFLTALVVLAIVQSVANAAAFVLGGFALMCAVVHPRQTFALIAALGGLALVFQRPGACVAVIGAALAIFATVCAVRRPRPVDSGDALPVLLLTGRPSSPKKVEGLLETQEIDLH